MTEEEYQDFLSRGGSVTRVPEGSAIKDDFRGLAARLVYAANAPSSVAVPMGNKKRHGTHRLQPFLRDNA